MENGDTLVPVRSAIWDGTAPHPLAEFAPFKITPDDRIALEAAYNASEPSIDFHFPDQIWSEFDVLLSLHRTQREEWKGDQPKTQVDQAMSRFDERLESSICDIENLMFNTWLRPQFEPDRQLWAELKSRLDAARSRLGVYGDQIKLSKFRKMNERHLHQISTDILQNILSRYNLSLVKPGKIQKFDIRRKEFLSYFFKIAKDPIDDVRERTLLTQVVKAVRHQDQRGITKHRLVQRRRSSFR